MAIDSNDTDQVFALNGSVVRSTGVVRDVTAGTNEQTLQDRAEASLAANATFLGIASPTNVQTLAEVKALARQNNGIIRLLLGLFDDVSDT